MEKFLILLLSIAIVSVIYTIGSYIVSEFQFADDDDNYID
jgi:hypothetical protein